MADVRLETKVRFINVRVTGCDGEKATGGEEGMRHSTTCRMISGGRVAILLSGGLYLSSRRRCSGFGCCEGLPGESAARIHTKTNMSITYHLHFVAVQVVNNKPKNLYYPYNAIPNQNSH